MARADAIDSIARTNRGRMPQLLRRKFDAMAADPFVFLRATARLSHEALDLSALPRAPLAWVCGDLHLQNFGCFRGENRLEYFDLNDFDEAALLPAPVDIVRLLASLLCAAPAMGLADSEARALALHAARTYAAALARGKAFWLERDTATGPVRELLAQTRNRRRRDLLASRTQMRGRLRAMKVDGRRYLAVAQDDPVRELIASALGELSARHDEPRFFLPIDIAFRVAGMGSLGVPRYVALVHGKGSPDRNALVDFKFAVPSAAALAFPRHPQPAWGSEAERVVTAQDWCQAASPAFLGAADLGGHAFLVRELQPVEDRVAIEPLVRHRARLDQTLGEMARLAAWAHLRAAPRRGAAGPAELADYGLQARDRADRFVAVALHVDAASRAAHARFRRAWKARDPRLVSLCSA
jgi:uncharacterized protein (DUF2252 family)